MFLAGVHGSICKILLVIFDVTASCVLVGHFIGVGFLETVGLQEGAVESPVVFSIYISGLRARLENEHPNPCTLSRLVIAVLFVCR